MVGHCVPFCGSPKYGYGYQCGEGSHPFLPTVVSDGQWLGYGTLSCPHCLFVCLCLVPSFCVVSLSLCVSPSVLLTPRKKGTPFSVEGLQPLRQSI